MLREARHQVSGYVQPKTERKPQNKSSFTKKYALTTASPTVTATIKTDCACLILKRHFNTIQSEMTSTKMPLSHKFRATSGNHCYNIMQQAGQTTHN